MKTFEYKKIKDLFLQVGSKAWADSRMCGRCGISKARLQKLQELAPEIPIEFFIFPERYKETKKDTQC